MKANRLSGEKRDEALRENFAAKRLRLGRVGILVV